MGHVLLVSVGRNDDLPIIILRFYQPSYPRWTRLEVTFWNQTDELNSRAVFHRKQLDLDFSYSAYCSQARSAMQSCSTARGNSPHPSIHL